MIILLKWFIWLNMLATCFALGMTGKIVLDENGDRQPDYWITDMLADGTFVKIAEVVHTADGETVSYIG